MDFKEILLETLEAHKQNGYDTTKLEDAIAVIIGTGLCEHSEFLHIPNRIIISYTPVGLSRTMAKRLKKIITPFLREAAFWVGKYLFQDRNPIVTTSSGFTLTTKGFISNFGVTACHPSKHEELSISSYMLRIMDLAPDVITQLKNDGLVEIARTHTYFPIPILNSRTPEAIKRIKSLLKTIELRCPICGSQLADRKNSKTCRSCKDKYVSVKRDAIKILSMDSRIPYHEFCQKLLEAKRAKDDNFKRFHPRDMPWVPYNWDSLCRIVYRDVYYSNNMRLVDA